MDLLIASSVMLVICVTTAMLVVRMMALSSRWSSLVLCLSVGAATACVYFLNDWLTWAKYFPWTAAIIWTNLAPVFLSAAAAAAIAIPKRPLWRRVGLSGLLAFFAMGTLLQPIVQPVIRPVYCSANTVWMSQEVCHQSGSVTCSPAAAATLLRARGIEAEESQLAKWCLTDSLGTTSLGLWRGLRLATTGTQWEPQVLDVTLDDLTGRNRRDDIFPCLVVVGIPRFGADTSPEVESKYTEQYGWPRGFRHSVVLFGPAENGMVDVGDPSIGRERWANQDLEILWRGEAVGLVRRDS